VGGVLKSPNRKNYFRKLSIPILCGFFFAAPMSFAQEMLTIEKYVGQNNFDRNPGAMQFVFLRCASIFLLVGGYLQEQPGYQADGKKFSEAGNSFLEASLEKTKPSSQQFVVDQISRMTGAYKERWLRAKALSGNFSDDP